MREAIGSSLLLSIVVVFIGLIILFFVGILSYSKAYKAKNRIVEIIEKYETYNSLAISEIDDSLSNMGYQLGACKDEDKKDGENSNINSSGYKYCIYKIEDSDGSYYYKVKTYVQFYFPIIGELFNPPVQSETKILKKNFNYE